MWKSFYERKKFSATYDRYKNLVLKVEFLVYLQIFLIQFIPSLNKGCQFP